MKNFINLKDISAKDLRKILNDAKRRKNKRKKLSNIDVDNDQPLKGKLIIQMYEKQSSRTRLSSHLAIAQLGGGTITIKANELHLGKGGESLTLLYKTNDGKKAAVHFGENNPWNWAPKFIQMKLRARGDLPKTHIIKGWED